MTEFTSKSEISLSMSPAGFQGRVLEVKIAEDISCAFCARTFHVDEEPFIHGECPSDDCPSNSTDDEKYAIDLEPYEPAQPVHLPRYVKKGRDARPSRNPFAEPSVSKYKRRG